MVRVEITDKGTQIDLKGVAGVLGGEVSCALATFLIKVIESAAGSEENISEIAGQAMHMVLSTVMESFTSTDMLEAFEADAKASEEIAVGITEAMIMATSEIKDKRISTGEFLLDEAFKRLVEGECPKPDDVYEEEEENHSSNSMEIRTCKTYRR